MTSVKTDDATKTLEDILGFDGTRDRAEVFAIVAKSGTLADAKAKLDSVAGAQDVFVTETGGRAEPVLGWITNSMIVKRAAD